MEQGMDAKTLSILLGTLFCWIYALDTYAHVLTDQKWTAMQTMADMYNMSRRRVSRSSSFERIKLPERAALFFCLNLYSTFSNRSIFSYCPAESIPSIKGIFL